MDGAPGVNEEGQTTARARTKTTARTKTNGKNKDNGNGLLEGILKGLVGLFWDEWGRFAGRDGNRGRIFATVEAAWDSN